MRVVAWLLAPLVLCSFTSSWADEYEDAVNSVGCDLSKRSPTFCDDGDTFANDEGLWRTRQIQALDRYLSARPSERVQAERDQIALTGKWGGSGTLSRGNSDWSKPCERFEVSIDRVQGSRVRMEVKWVCQGQSEGYRSDYSVGFAGDELSGGVGIFGGKRLRHDTRTVTAGGILFDLRIVDNQLQFRAEEENHVGSTEWIRVARLTRLDSTPEGSLPKPDRRDAPRLRFLGSWVGEMESYEEGTERVPGNDPSKTVHCHDVRLEVYMTGNGNLQADFLWMRIAEKTCDYDLFYFPSQFHAYWIRGEQVWSGESKKPDRVIGSISPELIALDHSGDGEWPGSTYTSTTRITANETEMNYAYEYRSEHRNLGNALIRLRGRFTRVAQSQPR